MSKKRKRLGSKFDNQIHILADFWKIMQNWLFYSIFDLLAFLFRNSLELQKIDLPTLTFIAIKQNICSTLRRRSYVNQLLVSPIYKMSMLNIILQKNGQIPQKMWRTPQKLWSSTKFHKIPHFLTSASIVTKYLVGQIA